MSDGQIDSPNLTYRVVGICPDKSRLVVDEGLTRQRAEEVERLILTADAFRVVEIEPEGLTS
jgi:hypothetical protein